jgi:hypothetical protein
VLVSVTVTLFLSYAGGIELRVQEHLDGAAFIHRSVAVRGLVERQLQVEYLAWVNLPVPMSCISSGRKRRTGAGPPCRATMSVAPYSRA